MLLCIALVDKVFNLEKYATVLYLFFDLPSKGFEPTILNHYSRNSLALGQTP